MGDQVTGRLFSADGVRTVVFERVDTGGDRFELTNGDEVSMRPGDFLELDPGPIDV